MRRPRNPAAVLVTGASGFLGTNVTATLLGAGRTVVAFGDRAPPPAARRTLTALPGTLHEVAGDVRDGAAIAAALRDHGVDRVVHAAAVTLPPGAPPESTPPAVDVNVAGTAAVLGAAIAHGVARLVFPSSTAVYGDALVAAPGADLPLDESTPPAPTSAYGITKLAAESLVAASREHGLSTVRARVTAVFGPWEHPTGARAVMSPPWQLAQRARAGAVTTLPRGGARDWTWAPDVAAALVALLDAPRTRTDLYHVGIGTTWHPWLLATELSRVFPRFRPVDSDDGSTDLELADDPSRTRRALDAGRICDELGLTFRGPRDATDSYARWLTENC